METIKITRYQSPVGEMLVGSYGDKLCICDWMVEKRRGTIDRRIQRHLNARYEEGTSDIIERAIGELEEYFAGHRKIFDIPVVFTGSEFQCTVWEELMKIPYGTTISYGELARRIHNPKAVRAVASANATNPISIFVPCHRVIGSNHKLTGTEEVSMQKKDYWSWNVLKQRKPGFGRFNLIYKITKRGCPKKVDNSIILSF